MKNNLTKLTLRVWRQVSTVEPILLSHYIVRPPVFLRTYTVFQAINMYIYRCICRLLKVTNALKDHLLFYGNYLMQFGPCLHVTFFIPCPLFTDRPKGEGNVFTGVCLSTIGLMASRSLLGLVTVRSARILLKCFLVWHCINGDSVNNGQNGSITHCLALT